MRFSLKKLLFTIAIGLLFCSTPAAKAEDGFKLPSVLLGEFGTVTAPMEDLIINILGQFGMADAAIEADNALADLASGQIPVISKLQDPFQGNVEDSVEAALADAQIALNIMNNVTGPAIQTALSLFMESVLFSEADFGITLPTGRVKVYRKGTDISICITTVGPAGTRITTGISNAEYLCNNPAPRMANESRALTLFTDMAVGYTHVQTRQVVLDSQIPYSMMPPSLEAETYININGQWVQIRLAGADPESAKMTAEFEVGLKAGAKAALMAEAGASVALSIEVKPTHAEQIIQETLDVMTELSEAQLAEALWQLDAGEDPTADVLENAGAVIKAGLDHLQTFNRDPDYAGELGEVKLVVGASLELGVGIWDTGIAGLSGGAALSTSLPLESLVTAESTFFSQYLENAFNLSKPTGELFRAFIEGEPTQEYFDELLAETSEAVTALVNTSLEQLLQMSTELEMEFEYKITALGEVSGTQKNSMPIFEGSIKFPTGDLIDTIANEPEAIDLAIESSLYLVLSTIYPEIDVDWSGLSLGIADGVEFSLKSMINAPLVVVGFSEIKLVDLLEMMETDLDYIRPILTGVIQSGLEGSVTPLRTAVEEAIAHLDDLVDENFLQLVQSIRLNTSTGFGANGDLGAEGVLKLGAGARLEGELKASLLLLLSGREEYEEEDGTVLASLSLPVNVNMALGASLSEGVEFEVTGGGSVATNLFSFTMTHWDGALPPPAGMTVAGFEVMEFSGEVRNDESFTGTGFLCLPMGGIVEATFDVDADGTVLSGSWWGGFDLGPLGTLTLGSGPLTNEGIEGVVSLGFFNADFTLTSSGWVYGCFVGNLTIGGVQLSAFELTLEENGFFSGNGFIDLGGFQAEVSGQLNDETGFIGNASLDLLGSTLEATDLSLTSTGASGEFSGDLVLFGYTFSDISLSLINGGLGLRGTAKMDLFGTAGVEMTLEVNNGILTATTNTGLWIFGTQTQASSTTLTFTEKGVTVTAVMNDDLLGTINSEVTEGLNLAASEAQVLLADAMKLVTVAQAEVDKLNYDIEARRLVVISEREKAVEIAQKALDEANKLLLGIVAEIESVHNTLYAGITIAQDGLTAAKNAVTVAKKAVSGLQNEITALDNWYYSLDWWSQTWSYLSYQTQRTALVAFKVAADLTLTIAEAGLTTANTALTAAWNLYNDGIDPLKIAKTSQTAIRDAAQIALDTAEWALSNPDTDPAIIFLKGLHDTATIGLNTAWKALHDTETLIGSMAQIAIFINEASLDLLFRVTNATFEADYQGLGANSFVNMTADILFMGQARTVEFAYGLSDPVGSFQNMASSLQTESTGDVTAPLADAAAPSGWQNSTVTVTLNASDDVGGSGVASITYSASGAQVMIPVSVQSNTTQVEVSVDGETTISCFATDNDGNVSSVQTITVYVDQTAPQIALNVPEDGFIVPGDIRITATDNENGSGFEHMTVSTTGTETQSPEDLLISPATVSLSAVGQTVLTIVAYDTAGNSTTISRLLTVTDNESPVVTAPEDIEGYEANGVLSQVPIGTASATDNVGVVSVTNNAPNNFPTGTTTVVWTALDAAGNKGTASQQVTVVDTTAPVITTPANILDHDMASGVLSSSQIGMATATDNIEVVSVSNNAPDEFPLGSTIVVWTAVDASGNTGTANQLVTVKDTRLEMTEGDFNGDYCVDRTDYTQVITAVRAGISDLIYDLNGDGQVNIVDARYLVLLFTNPRGAECQ